MLIGKYKIIRMIIIISMTLGLAVFQIPDSAARTAQQEMNETSQSSWLAATSYSVFLPLIEKAQVAPAAIKPTSGKCTAVTLKKGPTLIFAGNNTGMRVAWQWSANSAFSVQWGTSASYGSSAAVSAYDTTNHLYKYDIGGLTPGSKYYYRVVTGSQCATGTF